MKNFLQAIATIQGTLVARLIGDKQLSGLSKIFGVTIPGEGTTSFAAYGKILEKVREHTKEWRRFKEDPNKIVLQKDLFLNCLDLVQGGFLFRVSDDEGSTYLDIPNEFFQIPATRSCVAPLLCWLTFFISLYLTINLSSYFALCFLLPVFLVVYTVKDIYKKNEEEANFLEERGKKQFLSFQKRRYSFSKAGSLDLATLYFDNGITWTEGTGYRAKVQITFGASKYQEEYAKALRSMTIDAHQLYGKISWLWFTSDKVTNELAKFNYDSDQRQITLGLNLENACLIPVIETEYSFIFSLEYFSEYFEEYGTGKELTDELMAKVVSGDSATAETLLNPVAG